VLVAERPDEGALKLVEEPVLGARGIGPVEVLFAMEDVDVRPREPGLQQSLDGSPGMLRVDDRAHHAIGWIRDEIVGRMLFASHGSAIGGGSYTMWQRGAREACRMADEPDACDTPGIARGWRAGQGDRA